MNQTPVLSTENNLTLLAAETEAVLEDIFLSGFHSVRKSTIEKLDGLLKFYQSYNMKKGVSLILELKKQLVMKQESFCGDIDKIMAAYSKTEFYLEYLKSRLTDG